MGILEQQEYCLPESESSKVPNIPKAAPPKPIPKGLKDRYEESAVTKSNEDSEDDMVVIGEVKRGSKEVDDSDDDCVILDGDPNKVVSVVEDKEGSDDLAMVGEKGQIACRDYPHPRHLCVKFPFTSTPHEKHCELCHCYVCDSLAPCAHWNTDAYHISHCHATEKIEMWKLLRRNFKAGTSSTSSMPAINVFLTRPQPHQLFNSTVQQQPSSASQLSNAPRSDRAQNTSHGGLHRTSAAITFKRVAHVRGSSANGPTYSTNCNDSSQYGSLNNSGYVNPSQYGRMTSPMPATSNNGIRFTSQEVHNSLNQVPSQPMASGNVASAFPPQHPQMYSQPIPQSSAYYSQNVQSYGHNIYQYEIQGQDVSQNYLEGVGPSAVDLGFTDCNFSWMHNSSQSIQQHQPPILNPQVQSTTEAIHAYNHNDYWLQNQPVPPGTYDSLPPPSIVSDKYS